MRHINPKAVALKWWMVFCASAVGLLVAWAMGLLNKLWEVDQTKLSFVILIVYFVVSAFVGWMTYRQARGYRVPLIAQHLDCCDEASDLLMKIAIMGTTLGFFILISAAFGNAAAATAETIGGAVKGLAIIYLVTFVGVLCSSLLNLQLVNLRYLTDE